MARRLGLLGAVLGTALLAGGGLAQAQLGDAYGNLLVKALESQLPPGSEITYTGLTGDPFQLTATLQGFNARLGPANAAAGRLTATTLEASGLTPDLTTVARIRTLSARDLAFQGTDGLQARLGSISLQDLSPLALPTLLQGRFDKQVASGPIQAGPISLSGGTLKGTLTAARLTAARIDDGVASGLAVSGLEAGEAGGALKVGQLNLASVDWSRVDRSALVRLANRLDRSTPRPANEDAEVEAYFATIEALTALAEGQLADLQVSGVEFRGNGPEPGSLQLQRLSLSGVSRQGIGPLTVDELRAGSAELALHVTGLSYDMRLDRLPLEELRAALGTAPRSKAGLERLKAILKSGAGRYALRLASVEAAKPDGSSKLSFGELEASGSGDAARATTSFNLGRFAFSPAGWLDEPARREGLVAAGLGEVQGRIASGWSSEAAAGRLSLDNFRLELDQLGTLELQAGLQGLGDPALDPLQALTATSLGSLRLVYVDRSLVGRLLQAWGGSGGLEPATIADTLGDILTDPARTPWLDQPSRAALASFLRRPGRLEISLAPQAPVAAAQLMTLALRTPQQFAPALGLKVTATPP